uniref:Uncharacterized protein n=1 Tax=Brassica oleracea var. oleracea TaxID=109376 RepID=A0A0D3A3F4_BRAOL
MAANSNREFLLASGAVVGDELPGYTVIGGNYIIGHHAVHGDECFLCIGNNNEIRKFCSIHRSSTSSDKTVHNQELCSVPAVDAMLQSIRNSCTNGRRGISSSDSGSILEFHRLETYLRHSLTSNGSTPFVKSVMV